MKANLSEKYSNFLRIIIQVVNQNLKRFNFIKMWNIDIRTVIFYESVQTSHSFLRDHFRISNLQLVWIKKPSWSRKLSLNKSDLQSLTASSDYNIFINWKTQNLKYKIIEIICLNSLCLIIFQRTFIINNIPSTRKDPHLGK